MMSAQDDHPMAETVPPPWFKLKVHRHPSWVVLANHEMWTPVVARLEIDKDVAASLDDKPIFATAALYTYPGRTYVDLLRGNTNTVGARPDEEPASNRPHEGRGTEQRRAQANISGEATEEERNGPVAIFFVFKKLKVIRKGAYFLRITVHNLPTDKPLAELPSVDTGPFDVYDATWADPDELPRAAPAA